MTEKPLHERYPSLFHYTNAAGLDGILKSQTLWATHAEHLNDSQELKAARPLLMSVADAAIRKVYEEAEFEGKFLPEKVSELGGKEEIIRQDVKRIIHSHDDPEKPIEGSFVISFYGVEPCLESEYDFENGVLSQWRGYGNGEGYAIELDTEALDRLRQESNLSSAINGVSYKTSDEQIPEELIKLYQDFYTGLYNSQKEMLKGINEGESLDKNIVLFLTSYLAIVTFTKHRSFFEEKEIRIAAYINKKNPEREISTFLRKGKLTPYIELFEGEKERSIINSVMKLPIKRIIVGPHPDKEGQMRSLKALKTLLHNVRVPSLGNAPIEIHPSDIPYIG